MKKFVFILLFLSQTMLSNAQSTYYVESNQGFEQPVVERLTELGKSVTIKQESSTYTIKCVTTKAGMGRAKGYISIYDSKTGTLLAQSPKVTGQTTAFNGYANPQMLAIKKATKEHLSELIAKCSK